MSQRRSIKIIKRGERERAPAEAASRASKKEVPPDFSREVTSTVTSWVREFQDRKRTARQAL